jgi:hypothetical protein
MEAAARLDRRSDDDEFRAALGRYAGDLLAEAPGACADHFSPDADAVRAGHRSRGIEPLFEAHELPVEVRIDRQLALQYGRRDENDSGAAIGREPASEVEGVLRLLPVEQRHHDAPIGDRSRPAGEPPRAKVEDAYVWKLHFRSWYGTEARITFGSKSRSRLR